MNEPARISPASPMPRVFGLCSFFWREQRRGRNALGQLAGASLLLVLWSSLSGCVATNRTEADDSPDQSDFSPDQLFFQKNCAMCHGPKGEGKQIGDRQTPDLGSKLIGLWSDAQLLQQIANGGNGMPAFKTQVEDEQMQAMVKFIREKIQKRNGLRRDEPH